MMLGLSGTKSSRRVSTRRHVEIACQAVRLADFSLLSDRIVDLSAYGLMVPTHGASRVRIGDEVIVSFEIPGRWIDAEAIVSRVVHGLRPSDDGPALGLSFVGLPAASRAALAGFLHGRPPPLPRRGPLARLRRGEAVPRLADEQAFHRLLEGDVIGPLDEPEPEALPEEAPTAFGLLVLRELANAWRALGEEEASI